MDMLEFSVVSIPKDVIMSTESLMNITYEYNITKLYETSTDIWYYVWWMDLIRIIMSVIVPFLGVLGNLLVVLTVFYGFIKHSTAHLLIVNLAVSDGLFSLQNVVFSPVPIALER